MRYSTGDKVLLKVPMAFLKTSDPMPMLRPPDLVGHEEVGDVVGLRSNDIVEVRFRRGTFLIPTDHLAKKDDSA